MDDRCAICSRQWLTLYDAVTYFGVLPLCGDCAEQHAINLVGEYGEEPPDVYADSCCHDWRED